MLQVTRDEADRFYRSAMVGLALLDSRVSGGRRFGPDADARWQAFRGALQDWDRIELLVRDAAMAFGPERETGGGRLPSVGFAPHLVFDLPALADDEPCGPDLPGPEPAEAGGLLRSVTTPPRDPSAALIQVAEVWGKRPSIQVILPDVQPSTRLLIAGAGAVIATASLFFGRPELDLADQAVLVADDPATRQLFGLAIAFQGSRRPVRIVPLGTSAADVRALGLANVDRAVISEDIPAEVREHVKALGRQLGSRG